MSQNAIQSASIESHWTTVTHNGLQGAAKSHISHKQLQRAPIKPESATEKVFLRFVLVINRTWIREIVISKNNTLFGIDKMQLIKQVSLRDVVNP